MGITDKLKDLRKKAEDTAVGHKDQIHAAVEKAGTAADKRTGGKYHEQISKAGGKVDTYVGKLGPQQGDAENAPQAPGESSPAPPPPSE